MKDRIKHKDMSEEIPMTVVQAIEFLAKEAIKEAPDKPWLQITANDLKIDGEASGTWVVSILKRS
jgi:hypothetical protein